MKNRIIRTDIDEESGRVRPKELSRQGRFSFAWENGRFEHCRRS